MTLPAQIDDLLSVIVLGTTTSPGVVKVSGHDRNKEWDIQKAKGNTGSSDKLNGDSPGQFTCTFTLGGDDLDDPNDDFVRWDAFQKLIESLTNGPAPVALPIYHPDLARQKITEVSNGGVGGMVHDGKGGATVVVKFIEYKPEKPKPVAKAKAKPAQTYANTNEGGRSPPDPNAAAKRELSDLVSQAKKP